MNDQPYPPTLSPGGDATSPKTEALCRPITVRHLLSHTSGLTYGVFGGHAVDAMLMSHFTKAEATDWLSTVPSPQLCAAIAKTPLLFQPGAAWHYGTSSDVLGFVLEVAAARGAAAAGGEVTHPLDLGELMAAELFGPLGMGDAGFRVPKHKAHRLAECCTVRPGFGFGPTSGTMFGSDKVRPPAVLHGGGGLTATVDDYAKLMRFLQTGKTPAAPGGKGGGGRTLLSNESLAMMRANALPKGQDLDEASFLKGTAFSEAAGKGSGYGLGSVSVVRDPAKSPGGGLSRAGEFGWGGVASTFFFVDPASDLSAVFLTQLIPSSTYPMRPQLRHLAHWAVKE
jgi:CubicO group peptidase (beta-lactamase class C family)